MPASSASSVATRTAVLQEAGIALARSVVAAVREGENVHLLRQSGANSVIRSAHSSGRLLGIATRNPRVVGVLEDLLDVGAGLDIIERPISPPEHGGAPQPGDGELVVAIVRGDEVFRFDDPRVRQLGAGDHVVALCAHRRR